MLISLTGLGGGHVAIVDDRDADLVAGFRWFAARRGRNIYATANVPKKDKRKTCIYMHRLIYPEISLIDHRNGNGLDNRRENLRPANHSTNGRNSAKRASSPSPFKGVRHRAEKGLKSGRQWQARIVHGGRDIHLGYFATADEAADAYDTAALDLFGEYARPNKRGTK